MIALFFKELSHFVARVTARLRVVAHSSGPGTLYQLRYDEAGKPYGDDPEGLAKWIVEQEVMQELEESRKRRGPEVSERSRN